MYKLGIDLGGTNIAAGVVDENYRIVGTGKLKTNCPRPAEQIADDMAKAVFAAIENAGITIDDIDTMGIGSPGAINPIEGVVTYANNLDFDMVPLCKMLKERTGKDFYIENDANAAAYGEFIAGAGVGTDNFIAITLGTGVGGGVIIHKQLYSGSNYGGAELGHVIIDMNGEPCSCGNIGCWESYASASALIKQTRAAMEQNKTSKMWELCDGSLDKISGITAFNAMRAGDAAGTAVVDKYIYYVATGIINVVNIFQPDVLCIGGGVSKEGDRLIKPISEILAKHNYARNMKKQTVICTAALGNDAGIIGAAYLSNLYSRDV